MKGITPACAGNSLSPSKKGWFFEDHPRLRGEQRMVLPLNARDMGSPPLARGTGIPDTCNPGTRGITPACAGNSGRSISPWLLL